MDLDKIFAQLTDDEVKELLSLLESVFTTEDLGSEKMQSLIDDHEVDGSWFLNFFREKRAASSEDVLSHKVVQAAMLANLKAEQGRYSVTSTQIPLTNEALKLQHQHQERLYKKAIAAGVTLETLDALGREEGLAFIRIDEIKKTRDIEVDYKRRLDDLDLEKLRREGEIALSAAALYSLEHLQLARIVMEELRNLYLKADKLQHVGALSAQREYQMIERQIQAYEQLLEGKNGLLQAPSQKTIEAGDEDTDLRTGH